MVKDYAEPNLQVWRLFAEIESVSDFRTWRVDRFGEYPALPIVNEGAPYLALASPSEEEATMQIQKRGGTEKITWEVIVNDRTGFVVKIPTKLAKAAAWTLLSSFFDMLENNETIYDASALFTTGGAHTNQLTTALSAAAIEAQILQMKAHQDIDSIRPLAIRPRYLIVPSALYDLAVQIVSATQETAFEASAPDGITVGGTVTDRVGGAGARGPGVPNTIAKYGLQVVEVPHLTDANDWYLAADRGTLEYAGVAFLNGQESPSLFIQDLPNVGSFFDTDEVTYKVRHVWDRAIYDYRGWTRNLVT
jgi:hypothetical protein